MLLSREFLRRSGGGGAPGKMAHTGNQSVDRNVFLSSVSHVDVYKFSSSRFQDLHHHLLHMLSEHTAIKQAYGKFKVYFVFCCSYACQIICKIVANLVLKRSSASLHIAPCGVASVCAASAASAAGMMAPSDSAVFKCVRI